MINIMKMDVTRNEILNPVKLVECPRDAMQGWPHIIPTQTKIDYLNALIKVGFDTIDAGSFVSPKAVPQMADTADVISNIEMNTSRSKILTVVANERGAQEAVMFEQIDFLGFPFSISETFQKRNTNSTILESMERVEEIQNLCVKNKKQLVVYISMGFGNPYDDPYSEQIVFEWVKRMAEIDINIISLADTVGIADKTQIFTTTKYLVEAYPELEFGVHLHSTSVNWEEKIEAALKAGCARFDGALKGVGGCPFANDELVGNIDSERMVPFFSSLKRLPILDMKQLELCSKMAAEIFN